MSYIAIPLADKGFVEVSEFSNPVRWYVEDTITHQLIGPFSTKEQAEHHATALRINEAITDEDC